MGVFMFTNKEYIYEVYKERSFSKASKNLYISQPSLSASVKRVEQKIGTPIFDRSTSPINLTECGKTYIQTIEKIMELERNFQNYVDDLQQLKTGSLSIGGSNLFSSFVLPTLMTKFREKYPHIEINLVEENITQLVSLLSTGQLDFIIDNSHHNESLFVAYPYQREQLILAVPAQFPINEQLKTYQLSTKSIQSGSFIHESTPCVPLEQFQDEPFLFLKPENDTRQRALELCRLHGFTPHVLLYLDQQATAYNITCSGLGISFISDTLIKNNPPHPQVIYYRLNDSESSRMIYFYHKKGRYLTFAMQEFLKLIQAYSFDILD